MPQISVIVPVYNVEPYLHRCVDSVLSQTFADFELILVDDGSPDNCPAICDEYATADSRVRVIHQKNGGLSAARNTGIDWAFSNSDSHWLTFIDSDDWVHNDYLSLLLHSAIKANAGISRCRLAMDCNSVTPAAPVERTFVAESPAQAYAAKTCDMSACGKLYQKELFSNVRYPVGRLHEDAFTTYKLFFASERVATVDSFMYYCENNAESITRSRWNPRRLDEFCAYEEQLIFFFNNRLPALHDRIALGYLHVIEKQYHEIQSSDLSDADKKLYQKYTSCKMRTMLKRYRKATGLTIAAEPGIFEIAYPRLMELFWLFKVVKTKVIKVK